MDGPVKPTLVEKAKARLSVMPLLAKLTDDIKVSFESAIAKLPKPKAPIVNVEAPVVNVKPTPPTPIEVKTTEVIHKENKIVFPKLQRVAGTVSIVEYYKLAKALNRIEQKIFDLKPPGKLEVSNLPTEKILTPNGDKRDVLPVKIINKEFMVAIGGGGGAPESRFNDTFWLREEYTYITVSGIQVPSRLIRWSNDLKVTTDYQYDGNANPIVKSRLTEPVTKAGQ